MIFLLAPQGAFRSSPGCQFGYACWAMILAYRTAVNNLQFVPFKVAPKMPTTFRNFTRLCSPCRQPAVYISRAYKSEPTEGKL